MFQRPIRGVALLFILVGLVLTMGPVFGFTTFSADREVAVNTAEDPEGLLGITDNTAENDFALSPNRGWGTETAEIYYLEDKIGQFEENGFSSNVPQIRNEEGEMFFDPAIDASVEENADRFELVIACAEDEEGVDDDDYYVTVNSIASGSNTVVEFERETIDSIRISCDGEMPDQPPFFGVEIDGTNSPINGGDTLEVDTEITNHGDEVDTQDVRLEIDGEEVDRVESVSLDPGESTLVSFAWSDSQEGERDVSVRSDDDDATRAITIGDATSITAVSENEIGNNNEVITEFDVVTNEDEYSFEITIEDSRQGGENNWVQKDVTIGSESFELTDEAADDIAWNLEERDLLSAAIYEDANKEKLDEIRDAIDTDSSIEVTSDEGGVSLEIDIK